MPPDKAYTLFTDHLITGLPLRSVPAYRKNGFKSNYQYIYISGIGLEGWLYFKYLLDIMTSHKMEAGGDGHVPPGHLPPAPKWHVRTFVPLLIDSVGHLPPHQCAYLGHLPPHLQSLGQVQFSLTITKFENQANLLTLSCLTLSF